MKKLHLKVLILFFFICGCSAKDFSLDDDPTYISVMTGIYQHNFSSVSYVRKGKCPMYPSCSQFSKIACEKYGLILGGILSSDRLIRCGRDTTTKLKIININNRLLFFDPVPELMENSNAKF